MSATTVEVAASPLTIAVGQGRHRGERRAVRRVVSRFTSLLTTLLLLVGIAALLLLTVGPRVLHYRTATMLTGSMVPTVNPGDVVLDTQEPVADMAVGQIITYQIPIDDHRVESHRVIWLRHTKDGAVVFRTQGDANSAPDPWTARTSTPTVWRVRAVLPVVGSAIRMLRQPIMHLILGVALPAALVLGLLVTIWRPAGKVEKTETTDTAGSVDTDTDGGDADADATGSGRGKQRRDRRAAARRVAEMQRAAVGGDDAGAGRES